MITQCYTDSTIFKCLKKTCAFIFYFIKLHKAHFPSSKNAISFENDSVGDLHTE